MSILDMKSSISRSMDNLKIKFVKIEDLNLSSLQLSSQVKIRYFTR